MASLSLNNEEIRANIATMMGVSRTASEHDPATTSDIDRAIRAGRRKFFGANPNGWQFLESNLALTTTAPFESGTIEVVDGIVTLTGALWPESMDNYVLVPDEGGVYEVAIPSVEGDPTIVLVDTSLNLDALSTFKAYQVRYPFPANFGGWIDPLSVENSRNCQLYEYATLPEWSLRGIGNRYTIRTGEPELFAINQTVEPETGIPSWHIQVWPASDRLYVLKARIRIQPGDALEEEDVCHPAFAELMQEAILASCEVIFHDKRGSHWEAFDQMLPAYIRKDKMMRGTRQLMSQDQAGRARNYDIRHATIDLTNALTED